MICRLSRYAMSLVVAPTTPTVASGNAVGDADGGDGEVCGLGARVVVVGLDDGPGSGSG
jgi:hypothetical protein